MVDRDPAEFPEHHPSHETNEGQGDVDPLDEEPDESLEDPSEITSFPQPEDGFRVREDMATIALDRPLLKGVRTEAVQSARVDDWSALTDAEIMLRVREGDDQGFNYLIEKYRKPIIHFMFRMVQYNCRLYAVGEIGAGRFFVSSIVLRLTFIAQSSVIYDLALPHCYESGCESCQRHEARTSGSECVSGPARSGNGNDAGCSRHDAIC